MTKRIMMRKGARTALMTPICGKMKPGQKDDGKESCGDGSEGSREISSWPKCGFWIFDERYEFDCFSFTVA
jgi:hypothetical protein